MFMAPISQALEPPTILERFKMWQIDHTRLDIWIRVEVEEGVWEPREVWLTVAIDVHSRAIMGWCLSCKHPDAWTTALVLRSAVLEKDDPACPLCGLPETLVPDHGKDFMSHSVAALVRALGVRLDPCPPYYPNMKGEVERWFGTLNGYIAQLVGYMAADGRSEASARLRLPSLLTLPQLRAEVGRFIAEYHGRVHGTTKERPLERWQRTVHLSMPPATEDLNVLMLKSDQTRRVTKDGIKFTVDRVGGLYLAYELLEYWKQEVRIRYNPEDLDSILVYAEATGEYLCEAWLEGTRYGIDDVKRWRSGYRQELKKRTTAYAKEVEEDDRRSARARDEAFARARQMQKHDAASRSAAVPATPPESAAAPESDLKGVESLLQRFRQRDRGRASGLPTVIRGVSDEPAGEEGVA